MRIVAVKIIEVPEFQPFKVTITFEEKRDVLKFLKEVYDIQYMRSDCSTAFSEDEIPILKGIEQKIILESGLPSWDDMQRLKKESKK